jgi:hypothetical protein
VLNESARFERFTVFKPPAFPDVFDSRLSTNTPIKGAIFSSAESQGNGAQRSDDL